MRQSAAAPLHAYDRTDCLHGISLDADPTLCSCSTPTRLLEGAAAELLRTSHRREEAEGALNVIVKEKLDREGTIVGNGSLPYHTEIDRKPTRLPEMLIFEGTCNALEELWTVEIQPDILVDSSVAISQTARNLIRGIAVQLTYHDRLLLCCVKWAFNANRTIDRSWDFYHGQGDLDFAGPVRQYNKHTEEQITIEGANLRFAQIKKISESQLYEKYRYCMNVARTFLQLRTELQSDTEDIEYLCNQVYSFCSACLKDANSDCGNLLLRNWYKERFGWSDTHRIIVKLEEMMAKSEQLTTPASLQQAFELATVAHRGLVIQQTLPASERETHDSKSLLDSLHTLSTWAVLPKNQLHNMASQLRTPPKQPSVEEGTCQEVLASKDEEQHPANLKIPNPALRKRRSTSAIDEQLSAQKHIRRTGIDSSNNDVLPEASEDKDQIELLDVRARFNQIRREREERTKDKGYIETEIGKEKVIESGNLGICMFCEGKARQAGKCEKCAKAICATWLEVDDEYSTI